ncbi:protein phosphatase PTC7 homolog [Antedon mediterranea]|uniref:protein phosphatase PTC7 homolog n=1 Tax=Antedon mediterranea TaxID=105859 RepID=UPI003AF438F8
MQSVFVYGRQAVRAILGTLPYDASNSLDYHRRRKTQLITASCGFSKSEDVATPQVFKNGTFGDDAWFVASYKGVDVLGVADGVGGWRDYGIDPSKFPCQLMKTCESIIRQGYFNPDSPVSILAKGYRELMNSKYPLIGSSTACIVIMDNENKMIHSSNLGDSGFMIVRGGKIVSRSVDQQHYFNTPYQLSIPPPGLGSVLTDSPESASNKSLSVQEGDLILIATDGLFDNMSESMILKELSKLQDQTLENLQKTVNTIAERARELAYDPTYLSPFAMHARENGLDFMGGKPDDITILLSAVRCQDEFEESAL